jgi:phosphonate transport system substrate-binding protein
VPEADAKAVAAAFLGMQNDPAGRVMLEHASRAVGLDASASFVVCDGSEYGAYRAFHHSAPPSLR